MTNLNNSLHSESKNEVKFKSSAENCVRRIWEVRDNPEKQPICNEPNPFNAKEFDSLNRITPRCNLKRVDLKFD